VTSCDSSDDVSENCDTSASAKILRRPRRQRLCKQRRRTRPRHSPISQSVSQSSVTYLRASSFVCVCVCAPLCSCASCCCRAHVSEREVGTASLSLHFTCDCKSAAHGFTARRDTTRVDVVCVSCCRQVCSDVTRVSALAGFVVASVAS